MESASGGRPNSVGDFPPGEDFLRTPLRIGNRNGLQEGPGVGMFGIRVNRLRGSRLHDSAEVHDRDPSAHEFRGREIVGDEDICEMVAILQFEEELEHPRADRHIEHGDGLVRDDDPGPQREDACGDDSLLLPTTELVRIFGIEELRRAQAYVRKGAKRCLTNHPLRGSRNPLASLVDDSMRAEHVCNRLTDRHGGAQGRVRILVHHLNSLLKLESRFLVRDVHIFPAVADSSARRPHQPDERSRDRRLAATALPDEAEDLAFPQREGDPIDCVDLGLPATEEPLQEPFEHRKLNPQILDFEDWLGHRIP